MEPRSSALVGNRRAPIPRPWLENRAAARPVHPLRQDDRYEPPNGHVPPPMLQDPAIENDHLSLLKKTEWKFSLEKMACCFCMRPQSTKRGDGKASADRRRHHNDNVPFPAFPILRRNSSSSFLANENEIYPSSGSVSSFTESDTSYSDKGHMPVRTQTFDSEELRRPPSPPPPMATASPQKPQIVHRNRSAGLPPVNPTSNASFSGPAGRPRLDTSDYTRHSGTTTTSRHRRLQQFDFSHQSMNDIWQGKPVDDKLILPSYVLCQNSPPAGIGDSGYVSAMDDSAEFGGHNSDYYDGDDDGDDDIHFSQLVGELQRRKEERPPSTSARRRKSHNQRRASKGGNLPPKPKKNQVPVNMVPVYLRKDINLDKLTPGNLVLSGWVAATVGSSLEDRMRSGSKRIDAKDILYLRIIDEEVGARILLQSPSGALEHELLVDRDWLCQSREISSRIGHCVNIRSRLSMTPIATLLPVSLDDSFFSENVLVSAQRFGQLHDRMFVAGKGKVYAPDEQLDSAMYIMFSLDALIKNCL